MWYIARVPKPCIMALQKCMLHFSPPGGGKTVVILAERFAKQVDTFDLLHNLVCQPVPGDTVSRGIAFCQIVAFRQVIIRQVMASYKTSRKANHVRVR